MSFTKELLELVTDGDLHTKLEGVEYSTSIREVVTIGQMIERIRR